MSDIDTPATKKLEEKLIELKPVQTAQPSTEQPGEREAFVHSGQMQKELDAAYHALQNMKSEQHALLQETREIIQQEQEAWADEKQQYIEEAKKEGYEHGFATGKEESLTAYHQLLENANAIAEAAQSDYHAQLKKNTGTILDLAVHTAGKILQQEITEKHDLFLPIVTAALQEIKAQPSIKIYLHPDDYVYVMKQKEELNQVLADQGDITVLADQKAEAGHCLIEHASGQIDAGIDTQLEEIRKALHEAAAGDKQ